MTRWARTPITRAGADPAARDLEMTMASCSTGTIPPRQMIVDANQALALLDTMHHWSATRINRSDGVPGISVTITHAGRRATAQRRTFVDAVLAAMGKLWEGDAPKLRLAR